MPEVSERPSHGHPAFFVQGGRGFVKYMDNNHHGDGRLALWCAVPWGAQQALVQHRPEAYFRRTWATGAGWGFAWTRGWTGPRYGTR
ncbi:MAG: MmcQ/YjbR family DNA-binding protein [Meiothermus sp.]|nr:MmcQ/YjbR family DNA-binding protein [Meiothermus sp.]